MRLIVTGPKQIDIELTRRDLRTLLAMAESGPVSARNLYKEGEPLGWSYSVIAVEDDAHYSARPAGEVHPRTLRAMKGDGHEA
jgi:hypothetical protein